MQVAIFSDVHGNLAAMEAVLADIEKQRPDYTIFAGDISVFGARPADTLRLLRENRHIIALYGNTDEDILNPPTLTDDAEGHRRAHLQFKVNSLNWVREQLNEDDLRQLGSMLFAQRLSPSSKKEDDLLVVHANPHDVNRFMHPTAADQKRKLGSVIFKQSDEQLAELIGETQAAVLAFGHIHFPYIREFGELTMANISSTSNPMDGDTRARYGLLEWYATSGWQVEIRAIDYDIKREQSMLAERKPPKWEKLSTMLDGELFLG